MSEELPSGARFLPRIDDAAVHPSLRSELPTPGAVFEFGPFRLRANQRLLERHGSAVRIGSRALDILIGLVAASGRVVEHRELVERAWGSLVVGQCSLRVQVAHLRDVLGDGRGAVRYVVNVPGRGYSFVAPVRRVLG